MPPRLASVLIGLACLFILSDATAGAQQPGRIYKWVDEKGVTHYGQSIPPEYREQGGAEMNKGGMTVRRIDPVATPEQRKAAEERARRDKEEQKRVYEQRRRDTALLNTYTSPREIDEARERTLALPTQAIRGLEPRVKRAQERLAELEAKSDAFRKGGKPVPDHVQDDITDQKLELDGLRTDIERHQSQIEAIRARFDQDKQRYIELTQLTPR
jgi:hypothetical protein